MNGQYEQYEEHYGRKTFMDNGELYPVCSCGVDVSSSDTIAIEDHFNTCFLAIWAENTLFHRMPPANHRFRFYPLDDFLI